MNMSWEPITTNVLGANMVTNPLQAVCYFLRLIRHFLNIIHSSGASDKGVDVRNLTNEIWIVKRLEF